MPTEAESTEAAVQTAYVNEFYSDRLWNGF